MPAKSLLLIMICFIAGTLMPVQAGINNKLAKSVSNTITAAFISFAVGMLVLFVFLLLTKQFQFNTAAVKSEPSWIWLGGVLGAIFVTTMTFMVPKLGASLAFTIAIAGQLFISLIIDHYGWLGVPLNPVSLKKIAGILLVVAGVLLIRKN